MIRHGSWTRPTAGLCPGFIQVNLVILPEKYAADFSLFCHRNPKPCPVLEVITAGGYEPMVLAPGADVRTDFPRYRLYRHGVLMEEPDNIINVWRDDLVTFLIGCSFTFETAMVAEGLPIRHVEEGRNVPMFITNRKCAQAGVFSSKLVVSMRPIPVELVNRAVEVTARFPGVHGAPIHIGHPEAVGIMDIDHPDFGEAVTIKPGEVPVFWACGVTPQLAIQAAKPELAITHAPGYMMITDRRDEEWATGLFNDPARI